MADAQDKIVLLFKSKNEDDQYEKTLRAHGYEPVFIPVLSYEFINQDKIMEMLRNPGEFWGLVFTSQRAVDAVHVCVNNVNFEGIWRSSLHDIWNNKVVFVTGKATGQYVRDKLYFVNIFGEQSGSGKCLAEIVLEMAREYPKKALLFPCANMKKEILPNMMQKAGHDLCCVTAYNTKPDPNIRANLERCFVKKQPCCIAFFSPSGVSFSKHILERVWPAFHNIKLIAIGQTTAKALEDHDLCVSRVALKPEPIPLVNAINDVISAGK